MRDRSRALDSKRGSPLGPFDERPTSWRAQAMASLDTAPAGVEDGGGSSGGVSGGCASTPSPRVVATGEVTLAMRTWSHCLFNLRALRIIVRGKLIGTRADEVWGPVGSPNVSRTATSNNDARGNSELPAASSNNRLRRASETSTSRSLRPDESFELLFRAVPVRLDCVESHRTHGPLGHGLHRGMGTPTTSKLPVVAGVLSAPALGPTNWTITKGSLSDPRKVSNASRPRSSSLPEIVKD